MFVAISTSACWWNNYAAATSRPTTSPNGERTIVVPNNEPVTMARARAALDFQCQPEKIDAREVARLTGPYSLQLFFLARACGHDARYTCLVTTDTTYCVREPLDDDHGQPRDPGRLMP